MDKQIAVYEILESAFVSQRHSANFLMKPSMFPGTHDYRPYEIRKAQAQVVEMAQTSWLACDLNATHLIDSERRKNTQASNDVRARQLVRFLWRPWSECFLAEHEVGENLVVPAHADMAAAELILAPIDPHPRSL